MSFRLKIRATDKIERDGKALAAQVVFARLAIGESQRLQGDCRVWGYRVSVEALRWEDGDLLVAIAPPFYFGVVGVVGWNPAAPIPGITSVTRSSRGFSLFERSGRAIGRPVDSRSSV